MRKEIYAGLTRSQMINQIHMETDTSSWCYGISDEELIEGYKEVFGLEDNPTDCKVIALQ